MIDEYDAIAQVVRLFIEGAASQNGDKLRQAFHEKALLIGTGYDKSTPTTYTMSRDEFVAQYLDPKAPMDPDGLYRSRIVSIQTYGPDTAVAVVAEDHCWGEESFIDILSLWKELGQPWKIVNKVFTQPPGKA